eukprot:Em0206g8a
MHHIIPQGPLEYQNTYTSTLAFNYESLALLFIAYTDDTGAFIQEYNITSALLLQYHHLPHGQCWSCDQADMDQGQNYVYAITSTSVVQVPIEQCSSLTDCLSCAANVHSVRTVQCQQDGLFYGRGGLVLAMGAMWVVVAAARGAAGEVVVGALVSILLVPVVGLVQVAMLLPLLVAAALLLLLVGAALLLLLVAVGAALLLLLGGGGGSSAATTGGGGGSSAAAAGRGTATAGVGGAALLLIVVKTLCQKPSDKEAFLCIRLRMTPQYSIDRSQRTVESPCMLYM